MTAPSIHRHEPALLLVLRVVEKLESRFPIDAGLPA
jgi:hypothetical protein